MLRYLLWPIGRRYSVCLGNSNDHDGGVVPKLASAEIGNAVQQATAKRLRRQLTAAARVLGQALFAKLLAVSVHRLAQAIRKHYQAVSGPQVDLALLVNTILESTHDQAALFQAYLNTVFPGQNRWVVSGVGVLQSFAIDIQQAIKQGDELVLHGV